MTKAESQVVQWVLDNISSDGADPLVEMRAALVEERQRPELEEEAYRVHLAFYLSRRARDERLQQLRERGLFGEQVERARERALEEVKKNESV